MLQFEDFPPDPSYYILELRPQEKLPIRTVWAEYSVERLRSEDVEWVVTQRHPLFHSTVDSLFQAELDEEAVLIKSLDPFREGRKPPIYDPIDTFYVPLAGFGGVERPGPALYIYRMREAGS
jgi:hypothetical protein